MSRDDETECAMHYSEPDAVGCLHALILLGGQGTSREIRGFHNREAIHTSISNLREYLRRQGYEGETCPKRWMLWHGSGRKLCVYQLRRDVIEGLPAGEGQGSGTASSFAEATEDKGNGQARLQGMLFGLVDRWTESPQRAQRARRKATTERRDGSG